MTEDQLNQQLAKFFGQMTKHFDDRFNVLEGKVGNKADKEQVEKLYQLVDGIAQRLNADADEHAIVNHRTENWIGQLAKSTGTKLVPEQ